VADETDQLQEMISPERIRSLPVLPGVYLMKGSDGKVLYVGKAKNLRSRIRSYFSGGDGRQSVPFLLQRVTQIETVVTEDERQALILENDLIKKHLPRYNIRLKDDKAPLLVRIDLTHPWPRIELVRKQFEDGAKYIGPFAFSHELQTLLDIVRSAVPLRSCTNRMLINRVRPCLEYQLKRCAGPCCLEVDKAKYLSWVETAIEILEGKNSDVLARIEQLMLQASHDLRFEDAARLRDQLDIINNAAVDKPVYNFGGGSKDALGIHRDGERAEISVMQVRQGRLRNARTFTFENLNIPDDELLSSFLSQYYDVGAEIPEQILLPFELEDLWARNILYTERRGSKTELLVPEKGEKHRLVSLAQENARENFLARFGSTLGQGDAPLRGLKDELGIEQIPRTIECVDISHFQGGSTVASVVHFRDGRPEKTRYRHFHLATQEGKPDDFASMYEIVERHLSRCAEENTLPDLLIIDGGKAQLAQALAVRERLSLREPTMIGLAKKRTARMPYLAGGGRGERTPYRPERVYLEGKSAPIMLRESSKALHLLERIRDEAHRFAITFHRSTRTNRTIRSALDDITGLGNRRRVVLLREFGSVQRIKESSAEEITRRTGIPVKLAARILERLQQDPADDTAQI